MKVKSTDRVLISGLPGSGKSTLTAYISAKWMPNVYIFDTIDQHKGFSDENRYVPQTGDMAEFEAICKRLCTAGDPLLKNGCCTFVIEECEDYIGQGRMLPQYAYKVIRQGRNWGVGIMGVTQRIQEVDKKFVDRCQHIFFFKSGSFSYPYIKDLKLKMTNLWHPGSPEINVVEAIGRLKEYQAINYDMRLADGTIVHVDLKGGAASTPDVKPTSDTAKKEKYISAQESAP